MVAAARIFGDSVLPKKFLIYYCCNGMIFKYIQVVSIKKQYYLLPLFVLIIILCCCEKQMGVNRDFAAGSLLFDMGANSVEEVDYCKITDAGDIPGFILGEEDLKRFAKYQYKSDYPSEKLHELMVFPTNKLINMRVDGNVFSLYLMKDGNIVVRISEEEGFRLYQADEKNQIALEKYDQLVKKYCKEPIN